MERCFDDKDYEDSPLGPVRVQKNVYILPNKEDYKGRNKNENEKNEYIEKRDEYNQDECKNDSMNDMSISFSNQSNTRDIEVVIVDNLKENYYDIKRRHNYIFSTSTSTRDKDYSSNSSNKHNHKNTSSVGSNYSAGKKNNYYFPEYLLIIKVIIIKMIFIGII